MDYVAVLEAPNGTIFYHHYREFEELFYIIPLINDGYRFITIY